MYAHVPEQGDDAHDATAKFARINTAYEVLGDEIRRKRYEYALLHEKREDADSQARL